MSNRSAQPVRSLILFGSILSALFGMPAGAATERIVYTFKGQPDGQAPMASMIDVGGILYGTTFNGGTKNAGTVFSLTPNGNEKILHSFTGAPGDGSTPTDLLNVGGVLFGTTMTGGANGFGTVFSVTRTGVEKVLYSFKGGTDGKTPYAGLAAVNGKLYGTTCGGGANGFGTVFSVTKAGVEQVIYSFKGYPSDGANPLAGLTNVGGTLYGATTFGGNVNSPNANFCGGSTPGGTGIGTIFSITPAGVENVLYNFKIQKDVSRPASTLIYVGGKLYGTAGGVYSVTLTGAEKVVYSFPFDGSTGSGSGDPLLSFGGKLYGMAEGGGANSRGTVFRVTAAGIGKAVYSFQGYPVDGAAPGGGLVGLGGKLYGTTSGGGSRNQGLVFSITP